jgi:hypothetical protein
MATIAITALPVATAAAVADVLPIVQSGTTKQVTNALLFTNSTLVTPVLGTPQSGTLTNCTGLPVATGISNLGTGVATFLATPSSANLRTALTDETGTGSAVFATSPTLTTPVIGAATGTSLALTSSLSTPGSIINNGGSGKVGYAAGAGGTVTQATSKSTGVTLSKQSGQITMNAAALAASTTVSFTLTNTIIEANDVLILNHVSAGTAGSYTLNAQVSAGSASINVRNVSLGSLSEAIVIQFVVINAAVI